MKEKKESQAQRECCELSGEKMIGIIDYGLGNVKSMQNALNRIGARNELVSDSKAFQYCDKIIFPGVGNFGSAVRRLRERNLFEALKQEIENKPFLGVCLGMQLLFEESEESKGVKGLGVFRGKCKKFSKAKKIPQIGWNEISVQESVLFNGLKKKEFVYFVNSYFAVPKDEKIISCTVEYGEEFAAGVEKGNVFGLQFHPEKSGETGLMILKNFVEL